MHIKRIVICGFKSYKDEVVINDLDKGFNVIVGLNGSGKSNLFAAIQLALTEDFNRLSPVARTALLHMGVPKHDAAYVEVVFDNTDKRFPLDEDEVSFKRYIGGKKDRFVVNGKTVQEFRKFLEAAGFINPYYFVKQGSVSEIATATDAGRLKILTEMSGSSVWEDGKKAVDKILEHADGKLRKVDEILAEIDQAKANKKEDEIVLKEILDLEQRKRALEFLLGDRESDGVKQKLESVEKIRETLVEELTPIHMEKIQKNNDLTAQEKEIEEVGKRKAEILAQHQAIQANLEKSAKIKSTGKNRLQDLKQEQEASRKSKEELEQSLKDLVDNMNTTKEQLDQLIPLYNQCKETELELSQNFVELRRKADKNRSDLGLALPMFANADSATRKKEIRDCINQTKKRIEDKRKALADSEAKVKTVISKEIKNLQKEIQALKETLETSIKNRSESENQQIQIRRVLAEAEVERKKTLDQESKLQQELLTQRETDESLRAHLAQIAGHGKASAWTGVDIVLREMKERGGPLAQEILSGYRGLLFENIRCDPEVSAAVEVCAGEKLFYHVVKTNAVGLAILKEFNRLKLRGDLFLLPLDKVFVPELKEVDERDCVSIISQLKFKKSIEKAVDHVFGNKLLCRSLETAVKASKIYRTTCVTIDGDKVACSGPITGGYRDSERSVMGLQEKRSKEKKTTAELQGKLEEVQDTLGTMDAEFLIQNHKKELVESNLAQLNVEVDKYSLELRSIMQKLRYKQDEKVREGICAEKLAKSIREANRDLETLEKELERKNGNQNNVQLNGDALRILRKDRERKVKTCQKSRENFDKLAKLEKEKQKLELYLRNMAEKKLEMEISLQSESNEGFIQLKVDEARSNLKTIIRSIRSDTEALTTVEQDISSIDAELKTMKEALDQLSTEEKRLDDEVSKRTCKLNSVVMEENSLRNRLNDLTFKTKSLGTLPALVKKYERLNGKSISKKLREANIRLKELPNVNRMATDLVAEAEAALQEYNVDILAAKNGHNDVKTLVAGLDAAKNKIILRTCRALQTRFREIFSELVPDGGAEMVLTTSDDLEFNECTVIDTAAGDNIVTAWINNKFSGLALRVRFSGDYSSTCLDLKRFSGGQKSIVALSFILALQKCDPVSLYLFDEVDQALDPQYRHAVAKKMHRMAKDAQFICTTFRREFLDYASRFYGVFFRNQSSSVKVVSREEANDFIDDEEGGGGSRNQARGSANGVGRSRNQARGGGNGAGASTPSSSPTSGSIELDSGEGEFFQNLLGRNQAGSMERGRKRKLPPTTAFDDSPALSRSRDESDGQSTASRDESDGQTTVSRDESDGQSKSSRNESDGQSAASRNESDGQSAASRAESERQSSRSHSPTFSARSPTNLSSDGEQSPTFSGRSPTNPSSYGEQSPTLFSSSEGSNPPFNNSEEIRITRRRLFGDAFENESSNSQP